MKRESTEKWFQNIADDPHWRRSNESKLGIQNPPYPVGLEVIKMAILCVVLFHLFLKKSCPCALLKHRSLFTTKSILQVYMHATDFPTRFDPVSTSKHAASHPQNL